MSAPTWLDEEFVLQLHQAQIDEHGGAPGVLNPGGLASTLARPLNLLQYEPESSVTRLAASYGYGFAKNHCFNDGNKRIAFVAMAVFLVLNGYDIDAGELEATDVMLGEADGSLGEKELAAWLELRAVHFDIDAN